MHFERYFDKPQHDFDIRAEDIRRTQGVIKGIGYFASRPSHANNQRPSHDKQI